MSAATAAAYRMPSSDSGSPLALAGLDHALGGPAHAEVGLDGAGVPERADDLAVDGGVLALRRDHRVDVGRRATDVDDEHVAAHDLGEHLDAAEHGIRGGGAHQLGEPAAPGEALAADDVGEEGLADGGPGRLGRDDPDAGQHVGGDDVPAAGRRQQGRDLVGRLGVAGDDDRCGQPGPGDAARRCAAARRRCRRRCRRRGARGRGPPPAAPRRRRRSSARTRRARPSPRPTARPGARPRPSPRARSRRRPAAALPRRWSRRAPRRARRAARATARTASTPSMTSVATVVGWLAVPSTHRWRRRRAPPW